MKITATGSLQVVLTKHISAHMRSMCTINKSWSFYISPQRYFYSVKLPSVYRKAAIPEREKRLLGIFALPSIFQLHISSILASLLLVSLSLIALTCH